MGQAASKEGHALVDAVKRDDTEAVRTVSQNGQDSHQLSHQN